MKVIFRTLFFLFCALPLHAREILVVGSESMPWNGLVDGQPAGIYVDTLNEVTRHGGPSFKFRLDLPWARAQKMVMEDNGQPTVIIPLTRTAARESKFLWIAAVYADDNRLVSYKRKAPIKTLEEAKDVVIGVVNGHAIIPRLNELGLNKIDLAVDIERNMYKLSKQRFDTVCDAPMVYTYNWKKLGLNPADLQEGPVVASVPYAYVAASPDFPADLAHEIATIVATMKKDGSFQKIIDRWKK